MLTSSVDYFDLHEVYCGTEAVLPPVLCMLCLEIAGICGRGRRYSFFWIFEPRSKNR